MIKTLTASTAIALALMAGAANADVTIADVAELSGAGAAVFGKEYAESPENSMDEML